MAEYELIDKDNGEIVVKLGNFVVCDLYYTSDNVRSPLPKDRAKQLGEALILILKEEFPADQVDEDYEKGRLEEFLDSEGGEELFKMFLMGKMLGAI